MSGKKREAALNTDPEAQAKTEAAAVVAAKAQAAEKKALLSVAP